MNNSSSFFDVILMTSVISTQLCASASGGSPVQPNGNISNFRSGFYGGAHIGLARIKPKVNSSINYDLPDVVDEFTLNHPKKNIFFGGAVIGGRKLFSNGYVLGLNVEADFYDKSIKCSMYYPSTDILLLSDIKKQYVITPAFILGKVFNAKWLTYLKVGPNFSHYKMCLHYPGGNITKRNAKTKLGLTSGLGAEHAICSRWSLRCEALYEKSEPVKQTYRDLYNENPDVYNVVKAKVSAVSSKLSVIYKF